MGGKSKAGVYSPGPLGRTFVRVPLELITYAVEHGAPIKCGVLLTLMSFCGTTEGGAIWASCARTTICNLLGISEKQVSNAVASLVRDGIISVMEPGHNGRSTVYRVNIGESAAPEAIPTAPEAVHIFTGEQSAEERYYPEGSTYGAVGASQEAVPNRTFTEGSYRESSVGEEPSASEARVEGPLTGPEGEGRGYMTELQPVPTGPGESLASMFRKGGECRRG